MKKNIENMIYIFMWAFVLITCICTSASIECIVGTSIGLVAFVIKAIMEWKNGDAI